jgi:hypothetical protein
MTFITRRPNGSSADDVPRLWCIYLLGICSSAERFSLYIGFTITNVASREATSMHAYHKKWRRCTKNRICLFILEAEAAMLFKKQGNIKYTISNKNLQPSSLKPDLLLPAQ